MIDKAFLSTDLFLLILPWALLPGTAVYRRIRMPLLHPVLLTFVAVIVFLRAADIGYARYQGSYAASLDLAPVRRSSHSATCSTNRSNNCAEACSRSASPPLRVAWRAC